LVKIGTSEIDKVAAAEGKRPVGRPKKGAAPKRAARKDRDDFREAILYMKGSPEYFAFVAEVAKKTGLTKVQMFRMAFRDWCESGGHGKPPEI
jgi:hypothetical protein